MSAINLLQRIFSRWRSDQRYHTAGTQALALIPSAIIALFLLTGWQSSVGIVIVVSFVVLLFALFVQSKMLVDRPANRIWREVVKVIDIIFGMVVAVAIVFLAGSFTNMAILYITYVLGAVLTSEFHGRRLLQFGS